MPAQNYSWTVDTTAVKLYSSYVIKCSNTGTIAFHNCDESKYLQFIFKMIYTYAADY